MEVEGGKLYIVGSPIGNLGDVTLRAIAVLKQVSYIYAEDTRVSRKLLRHHGIDQPLLSYREAGTPQQVQRTVKQVLEHLSSGEAVAYLTDAGTPGVSDPGEILVHAAVKEGFSVVPVPGPSALASLLSVAGVTTRPLFVGFLPKKKGHQTLLAKLCQGLSLEFYSGIVFYESPERIVKLLTELLGWEMPLQICLGRELTKLHEEVLHGSLAEVLAELSSRPSIKGEISLLVYLER